MLPTCLTPPSSACVCRSEWLLRAMGVTYDRDHMTRADGFAECDKLCPNGIPLYLIKELHFLHHVPLKQLLDLSKKTAGTLLWKLRDSNGAAPSCGRPSAPLGSAQRPILVDDSSDDEAGSQAEEDVVDDATLQERAEPDAEHAKACASALATAAALAKDALAAGPPATPVPTPKGKKSLTKK